MCCCCASYVFLFWRTGLAHPAQSPACADQPHSQQTVTLIAHLSTCSTHAQAGQAPLDASPYVRATSWQHLAAHATVPRGTLAYAGLYSMCLELMPFRLLTCSSRLVHSLETTIHHPRASPRCQEHQPRRWAKAQVSRSQKNR
mgnify:CR=1 FL=1